MASAVALGTASTPEAPRGQSTPSQFLCNDGSTARRSVVLQHDDDDADRRSRSTAFSNFIKADQVSDNFEHPLRRFLDRLVNSELSQIVIGLATLVTFFTVAREADLRAAGQPETSWLAATNQVLFAFFLPELVARLYVERTEALKSLCTLADIAVVVGGTVEYVLIMAGIESELSKLRALRLFRLTKLARLLYNIPVFSELRKMVYMMASCFRTLFWSFIILAIAMTVWSIIAVELVHNLVVQLSDEGAWVDCERCRRSYSSVFHANLTFFQTIIAGDSWGLMAIPVIEAHPWTAFIFVGALLTLVFGVLNVIVAVVVDAFAEARSRDVMTRAREMTWEEQEEKKSLATIFKKIDADGNGSLDIDEIKAGARKVKEFADWLRVLDIDMGDLQELYLNLDTDGSGDVDITEFVEYLYRMKNSETKTATHFVKQRLSTLAGKVEQQASELAKAQATLNSVCSIASANLTSNAELRKQMEDMEATSHNIHDSLLAELSPEMVLAPTIAALEAVSNDLRCARDAPAAREVDLDRDESARSMGGGSSSSEVDAGPPASPALPSGGRKPVEIQRDGGKQRRRRDEAPCVPATAPASALLAERLERPNSLDGASPCRTFPLDASAAGDDGGVMRGRFRAAVMTADTQEFIQQKRHEGCILCSTHSSLAAA